jgi:hypothetical protein
MSDIVERLRHEPSNEDRNRLRSGYVGQLMREAAAEIERLRTGNLVAADTLRSYEREVERLRAENESLRRALDVVPGKPTEEDIEWARRELEGK